MVLQLCDLHNLFSAMISRQKTEGRNWPYFGQVTLQCVLNIPDNII